MGRGVSWPEGERGGMVLNEVSDRDASCARSTSYQLHTPNFYLNEIHIKQNVKTKAMGVWFLIDTETTTNLKFSEKYKKKKKKWGTTYEVSQYRGLLPS